MQNYHLDEQALAELRAAHRAARNAREAYRFNAVILLASGCTPAQVASALLLDDDTVRSHYKRYKLGGIAALERLNYVGREALLSPTEPAQLDAHLQAHLHPSVAAVASRVEERFGVRYTGSGMTVLLCRVGYHYKKPKLLPGKHPHSRCRKPSLPSTECSRKRRASTMRCYLCMPLPITRVLQIGAQEFVTVVAGFVVNSASMASWLGSTASIQPRWLR
jgi:transposase